MLKSKKTSCLLVMIILLWNSIFPLFSIAANQQITIAGIAYNEQDISVNGVVVQVCDKQGNPISSIPSEKTVNGGNYSFQVPFNSSQEYKLKFTYGTDSKIWYSSSEAVKYTKQYQIQNACKQLKVCYGIPKKQELAYHRLNNFIEAIPWQKIESHTVTYDGNDIYNEKQQKLDYTFLNSLKSQVGSMDLLDTKTVFVLVINNEVQEIEDIITQLSEPKQDNNEYEYFVLLANDLNDSTKQKLKAVQGERAHIYQNEENMKNDILVYTGVIGNATTITFGEGNEKECYTNSFSANENVQINLKLKEPTSQGTANGNNITGFIFNDKNKNGILDGNDEKITKPIEVNLYKQTSEGNKKVGMQITNSGEYHFGFYQEENNDGSGNYTIQVIYGGKEQTALAGYQGQNYTVSSLKNQINKQQDNYNKFTENEQIRKQVNEYFQTVTKDNASLVQQNANLNQNQKKELVNKVKMQANASFYADASYDKEAGEQPPIYYANLGLEQREEMKLELQEKVVATKMTLANGQILYDKSDKNKDFKLNPIYWQVDNEIMHGATVEIEYEITIKNTGKVDCKEYTLINYLDYNNNYLQYRENSKMITQNETNAQYGWKIKTKQEIQNKVKTTLHDSSQYLEQTGSLKVGETKTYKLIASVVTTINNQDKFRYENSTEIIQYKNTIGRVDITSVPGNYNPQTPEQYNQSNSTEIDSAESFDLLITPPTGR